jgi:hypothetical protein
MSKSIMKIKILKQIAIGLLATASLHGISFAGPATCTTCTLRPAPAVSGMPEWKIALRYQHAMTKPPSHCATQPAPSHPLSPGEGPFTVGEDWFRD